jgi:hypothetical protein
LEQPNWLLVIRSEFLEMPGLRLSERQAQRFWGLEPAICLSLLRTLVSERFLRCDPDGLYTRFDAGPSSR